MKSTLNGLVFSCATLAFAATASAQSEADMLAAAKAASMKYMDVNVALADGFIPDPSGQCVSAAAEGLPPEMGAMGIHYLNMARLQITGGDPKVTGVGLNVDFNAPSILLYEPQGDGSLVLVGVENLVFQDAWAAAGNSALPAFGDRAWDAMADDAGTTGDEAHGFAPHYDLHLWLFRENPADIYAPFNPAVSCG